MADRRATVDGIYLRPAERIAPAHSSHQTAIEGIMRIRFSITCIGLVLAVGSARGGPAEVEHLKIQLVSDTSAVEPGVPLWVGLHFEMEKGWHIYWRNPGDSGEPPRVRWTLPNGFHAGEIEWPAPARLGSGSVIDYGYEESVLLPVEIEIPKGLTAGRVTISADVSWLVCKDICVPGKARLVLSLPMQATPGSVSESHALFRAAKSRTPKPIPSTWKVHALSEKDCFVLTIYGDSVRKASFFPVEPDQIDNAAAQTLAMLPGEVRLTLKKADRLLKTPTTLDGVLEVSSGRAYDVSAPVQLSR
jgi:DsbC/DsbD-like thiol-disulfide interchange protein